VFSKVREIEHIFSVLLPVIGTRERFGKLEKAVSLSPEIRLMFLYRFERNTKHAFYSCASREKTAWRKVSKRIKAEKLIDSFEPTK